jgi:hypothetical protein
MAGQLPNPGGGSMRNFFHIGFLLLSVSCVSLPRWDPRRTDAATPGIPNTAPAPSETPASPAGNMRRLEEYAVYDAILEYLLDTGELQCIVLKDFTTARHLINEEEKTLQYVRENLPEMPLVVWDNFVSRNRAPVALEPVFHFALPMVLISQEAINGIFFAQEGDGWKRFYDTYQGAQGIMDISQAGFGPDFTQALVYAGNQSNYLAGIGFLYYMEKASGKWILRNSVMVWIS